MSYKNIELNKRNYILETIVRFVLIRRVVQNVIIGDRLHVQIVRLSIESDVELVDTLSDFLIGVLGMVVEFQVDDESSVTIIHGFITMDGCTQGELGLLTEKTKQFAAEMAEIFGRIEPRVSAEIIPDQDWSKNWKEYFKPFELIPDLIIAPSWETYHPLPGQDVIVMDPGMAFGTGHHATTKLCLELIKSSSDIFNGKSILDVGTGTGILGMACAMWGAAEVSGIDNDREAVNVATENVSRNNLHKAVVITDSGFDSLERTFALVVANIIHDTLIELADELYRVVDNGGVLILSGLVYGEQTDNIVRCFTKRGLRVLEEKQEGEWGAVKFIKAC